MNFGTWRPSHTLLLVLTLLAFGGQLVAILTHLKTTAKQHSLAIQKLSEQVQRQGERLEDQFDKRIVEVNQQISEVRSEMNQRLSGVNSEISKLNQTHIDHLSHHES